ncbi:unnamed protein product [Protopolystoma xenopodis]|uniref:Uncharacterized protein n=1 Tax=Protopolystoma xenopodis TaxID=117903 RepID=A0A3S4ZYK0_9PLAT|nr:unnamed protein product [Protopolystoma xenopodis]
MADNTLSPYAAKQLLLGQPDPLNSAFHLTYTMVLNLLRVDDIDPETMLERSFYQFQNSLRLPHLEKQVITLENDLADYESSLPALDIEESHISSYLDLLRGQKQLNRTKMSLLSRPKYLVAFLQPGRIVHVAHSGIDYGWGIILHVRRNQNPGSIPSRSIIFNDAESIHTVDCLIEVSLSSEHALKFNQEKPGSPNATPLPLALVEPAYKSNLIFSEDD